MAALDMDSIGETRVRQGGSWSAPATDIGEMLMRIGGQWVKLWSYLADLTVSIPDFVIGGGSSSGSISVQTDVVAVTVTGGQAPYSYSWARVGTGSPAWTITSPTGASTRFFTTVAAGTIETATFRCTVTDALGTVVNTNDCDATVENFGGYS
ncbi:hypothetical protein UFOVP407_4 [uncultured Caudovirales phage]|uniref:Uncharacterized protein n=1 Tax=uncultured Caudovirales phage TaxID=2100421 RepID=A0A6J5M899_9CAUD|nr:hypothetical protein UFOVP407_4 [uncultured Caudovirales phage]